MKKFLIILLAMFFAFSAKSQRKEIGVFIGTSYYNGDYNKFIPFKASSPAVGLLYSHTLSYITSFRIQGNYAKIKNNDDPKFSTTLYDIGLMMEFNFFKFSHKVAKNTYQLVPYFETGGFLLIVPSIKPSVNVSIPIGLGLKYAISEKATACLEWNYHIINTDLLDNKPSDENNINKKFAITNDYYSYFGLVFRFKIFQTDIKCPAYN